MKSDILKKPCELKSMIFQILISLHTFQTSFNFTHNDLHTNNIMYSDTSQEFIQYQLEGRAYKIPTFGKIFKIIDFGRAVYSYKGQRMCSNSYRSDGDAGSQYNCEPYFNPKKPKLEPHFGFDLSRLGCSLFELIETEHLTDDCDNDELIESELSDIEYMIVQWCKDDKGRNILFKKNGEERYPGFKLYKMIARTTHKHVPIKQLRSSTFDEFVMTGKKGKRVKMNCINIDAIPNFA
jgi:serine/threonine protein kinase